MHGDFYGTSTLGDSDGTRVESDEILTREMSDVRAGSQGKSRKTREAYVS